MGVANEDDVEQDEDAVEESERPRIVLTIRKSLLGNKEQVSKPPKKIARKEVAKCHQCHQSFSDMDRKIKSVLVHCGDHMTHKYCQEDCLNEKH